MTTQLEPRMSNVDTESDSYAILKTTQYMKLHQYGFHVMESIAELELLPPSCSPEIVVS